MRALRAATWAAVTLPATWAGAVVALAGSVVITVLNSVAAHADRSPGPLEIAFAAMPIGTVGAIVIGVTAISSEYVGDRPITTTLTAIPARTAVLAAKATVVTLLVTAVAAVTMPLTIFVACFVAGSPVPLRESTVRCVGAALYWILSGLIAFAVAVLSRNGVIPMVILIVNGSLVSFSLLLSKLTPLGFWLPDMAGRRLFEVVPTVEGGLPTIPGAAVMAAWTALLLAIAAVVFHRRDA